MIFVMTIDKRRSYLVSEELLHNKLVFREVIIKQKKQK